MTVIEISLPEELALSAKDAGLLSDRAIQALLRDAIRRRAGQSLLEAALDIQAAAIPPMSMDEIDAAVKAVRAERRGRPAADARGP